MTDHTEPALPNEDGVRAFQLRILSGMRNGEALVEQALGELGADRAEVESFQRATENIFAPTCRFENITSVLGPPFASETLRHEHSGAAGALVLTKLCYRLPVWPDLVFYFLGVPGLPIMHDFGFARTPGTSQVTLLHAEDLRPWGCLLDEVIASFGAPVHDGDLWAPYAEHLFQAPTIEGELRRFWAVFSWNLLQHVEWI